MLDPKNDAQKIKELEQAKRILQKKLEQSEANRLQLEENNEKKEALLHKAIEELRQSEQTLLQRSSELEAALTRLQVTQTKLAESEQFLHLVIDNIPQAIFWKDCDSVYLGCNQIFAEIVGVSSPQNITGKTDYDLCWNPEDAEQYRKRDRAVIESGKPQLHIVEKQQEENGKLYWLETNKIPLYDLDGQSIGILGTSEDITERKQAEEALEARVVEQTAELKKSQQRLALIIEQSPVGILEWNRNYEITQWNPAAESILGYSKEEALGRHFKFIIPEEFWDYVDGIAQELLNQEGGSFGINDNVTKDGRRITCEWHNSPLVAADGELLGAVSLFMDISERQRTEEELRASQQKLSLLIQQTPLAVIEWDKQFNVRDWNPAATKIFGYARSEAIGQNATFIIPEAAHPYVKPVLQDLLADRGGRRSTNANITKDGKEIVCEWHNTPLISPEGEVIGVASLVLDITERRQAENQLQEQEQFLRSIYDGVEHPIFVVDVLEDGDFRYAGWNAPTARATGITSTEIVGKTPEEWIGPEAGAAIRQRFEQCVATGQPLTYEEPLVFNGEKTWWLTTFNPLRNSQGRIYRLVATTFNISELKAVEVALQKSEAQLQAILNNSTAAIYVKDLEGRHVFTNPECERAFSLSKEEILGKTDFDLLPPKIAERLQDNDRWVAKTRRAIQSEEAVMQTDGLHTYLSIKFPLLDPDGNVYGICGMSTDISDRKQAEIVLHEQAERQELLSNITAQIRNSLNVDTILETTIRELYSLLQLDWCAFSWFDSTVEPAVWHIVRDARPENAESIVGTYPAESIGPIDRVLMRQEMIQIDDASQYDEPTHRAFLQSMGIAARVMIPIQTQLDQLGIIICDRAQPHSWTEREIELLKAVANQLAIAIDQAELYNQSRTKTQELEQTLRELQQTQTQLIQSEKMSSLGQLVAGVAHEINNPVSFIYGNITPAMNYAQELIHLLQAYQQHYPNPAPSLAEEIEEIDLDFILDDLPKLLSSMKVGAERICQIVLSLRTFSRLDEAEYKDAEIHQGIDSTLMILQHRLKETSEYPAIEVLKEYGKLPPVQCYPGQLNQVFMNIIANAIDALEERKKSRTPSRICITTELIEAQQAARITISDNGSGIPEAVGNRIFNPFFTTKKIGKGTGLGMSISYQIIVERHGGQLTYHSVPGKGTEFFIQIPLNP
ncbi:PAS domain S-box protein [Lusitaniella coriacea]|uniref:PAS domain-containing sensor histidine kinase n=1 Tax=Lusitaniella coriacea TaxID=1983105 RepID=UPI003CEADEB8